MEYATNSQDFTTVLRRVQHNDPSLTHLLVCETFRTANKEDPPFVTTYVKDGARGLAQLCDAIGRSPHLQDVCFDARNGLMDYYARAEHFDGLMRNEDVRSLGLRRCDLHQGAGRELLRALEEGKGRRVVRLALRGCRIRRGGPDALASALAGCARLAEVSLASCGVDDAVVEKLAVALKGHRELETLDLRENSIGGAGCRALAALLRDPECRLVDLDLHSNRIDDRGAKAVAGALAGNDKLEVLCLDQNFITVDGWNAYVRVLCDESSIDATFDSNHTLRAIASHARADVPGSLTPCGDGPIPRRLRELTSLNGRRDRARAARRKVLDAHFRDGLDAAAFAGGGGAADVGLLPHLLSWLGGSEGAHEGGRCAAGLAAAYGLLRQAPTLCDGPSPAAGCVRSETGCREMHGSAGQE